MMCYRDMTFCRFYLLCAKGHTCERALTQDVKEAAVRAKLDICQFAEIPTECFIPFFCPPEAA